MLSPSFSAPHQACEPLALISACDDFPLGELIATMVVSKSIDVAS
jgi:hypothetical protein